MKKILYLIVSFVFIFSLTSCSCSDKDDDGLLESSSLYVPTLKAYLENNIDGNYTYTYPFNTTISLVYFDSTVQDVEEYFKSEYIRLHQLFDRHYYYFDTSGKLINNLRIINESNGESVNVDQDLIDIFQEGIKFTKYSKGKFNIGVGNLSDLWDKYISFGSTSTYIDIAATTRYSYQNGIYIEDVMGEYAYLPYYDIYINTTNIKKYAYQEGLYVESSFGTYIFTNDVAPTEEQINQAKLCTPDYASIEQVIVIDDENNTIKINKIDGCNSNVTITLGALAKSYAAEKIANNSKIKEGNYLINAGQSTIKILGSNRARENGDWNIGITDSYLVYKQGVKQASYLMKISNPLSVSTSSGDENHYFYGTNYYHHIIDPISGYPNQNRFAVTAVSENAMYADIVTTSLMSMTMNESIEFLATLKNNNINMEILIQDKVDNNVKVYVTNSMNEWVSKRTIETMIDYLNSIVIEEFSYDSKEE